MSFKNIFHQQIVAFHAAIIDDCHRAAEPGQTDAMALRLRDNAAVLAKLQLAMLALGDGEIPSSVQHLDPAPEPAAPDRAGSNPGEVFAVPPEDRVLAGDALCRFVSRRLEPDESPHEVWQDLQAEKSTRHPPRAERPKEGFRSRSG